MFSIVSFVVWAISGRCYSTVLFSGCEAALVKHVLLEPVHQVTCALGSCDQKLTSPSLWLLVSMTPLEVQFSVYLRNSAFIFVQRFISGVSSGDILRAGWQHLYLGDGGAPALPSSPTGLRRPRVTSEPAAGLLLELKIC